MTATIDASGLIELTWNAANELHHQEDEERVVRESWLTAARLACRLVELVSRGVLDERSAGPALRGRRHRIPLKHDGLGRAAQYLRRLLHE
jgi:hypothetical protein